MAPSPTPEPGFSVTFVRDGAQSTYVTHAKTVAGFLAEQGIAAADADLVVPARDSTVVDGERIEYRPAFTVQLIVGGHSKQVTTVAANVAELLSDQDVQLGPHDSVQPSAAAPIGGGAVVRVVRENVWIALRREYLPAAVKNRYDPMLAPGKSKTIARGNPGERDITVQFVQRDGGAPHAQLIASRVVRKPHAKIVVHGIGEYAAFAKLAERGFDATVGFARSALQMVATAYTAGCYGCSGFTASGSRAGHGIVAVDPRVIPLGSKLFIPGYGHAVAGDTGGAIIGRRIDLGFDSLADALRFGRRAITVYVLR